MHPDVHVISIKPDIDGHGPDEEADGDSEEHDGDGYDAHLKDAFHAAKEDDEAGFIAAMRAAIKLCIEESEQDEDGEPKDEEDH